MRGQKISLQLSRAQTDHSRLALRTEKSLRVQEAVLGQSVCPQETVDLHTLVAKLLNVGKIIISRKIGKIKNKKGKPPGRETQGAVVRRDWYKDYWPGTSQIPACVIQCASW